MAYSYSAHEVNFIMKKPSTIMMISGTNARPRLKYPPSDSYPRESLLRSRRVIFAHKAIMK